MTNATSHWLTGRNAMVVGQGSAIDAVCAALSAAGAGVHRGDPLAVDGPQIAASFDAVGHVDLLVHGGVPMADMPSEHVSLEAWRAGLSADIDGRFLYAAEFARRSIKDAKGGNILFLMPPLTSGTGRGAVASAHGALDNLVKSLAAEWGRDGICINAIASRVVEDFDAASGDMQASLANLSAYLLSGYGAYITGSVMGIDEG